MFVSPGLKKNDCAICAGMADVNDRLLTRFLMTTKTERILAAGPGQSAGVLPESVAQDFRPAWIPHGLHIMDVDWAAAVKAHPAATKAVKEILLDQ